MSHWIWKPWPFFLFLFFFFVGGRGLWWVLQCPSPSLNVGCSPHVFKMKWRVGIRKVRITKCPSKLLLSYPLSKRQDTEHPCSITVSVFSGILKFSSWILALNYFTNREMLIIIGHWYRRRSLYHLVINYTAILHYFKKRDCPSKLETCRFRLQLHANN